MGEFNGLKTIRAHYKRSASNQKAYVTDTDLQVCIPSYRQYRECDNGEETHSFHTTLSQYLESTTLLPHESDPELEGISPKETTDVTQVMQAVDQADVGFQLMMDVHHKLINAYNEVMRSKNKPE